jgi:hypothetical protein
MTAKPFAFTAEEESQVMMAAFDRHVCGAMKQVGVEGGGIGAAAASHAAWCQTNLRIGTDACGPKQRNIEQLFLKKFKDFKARHIGWDSPTFGQASGSRDGWPHGDDITLGCLLEWESARAIDEAARATKSKAAEDKKVERAAGKAMIEGALAGFGGRGDDGACARARVCVCSVSV